MMKYELATMTPEKINTVIDTVVMDNRPGKTCHGPITVYVETRGNATGPMSYRCEQCGGRWQYTPGTFPPGIEGGHWRVAPDYMGDMQEAMNALGKVATSGKHLQEAVDFFLFKVVYNERGMPELKTGMSVVQRVCALDAKKICFSIIHALNKLDEMENAALERMRGGGGSGRMGGNT